MALTSWAATAFVRHIHYIEDFALPTGLEIEWKGVRGSVTFGSASSGAATSTASNSSSVVFPGVGGGGSTATLYGTVSGTERALYTWAAVGEPRAGYDVTFAAGKFVLSVTAAQGLYGLAEGMVGHLAGLTTCTRPDRLDLAIIQAAGINWLTGDISAIECTRPGYARLTDTSGDWENGTSVLLGSYGRNTVNEEFGPAGAGGWSSAQANSMLMVDSAGKAWWPLASNSSTVNSGDKLIFDAESAVMRVT